VGDCAFQTEWQALNKHGGLGRDPEARRALLSHIASYPLGYVSGLVWSPGTSGREQRSAPLRLSRFPTWSRTTAA
jgi:hypothetical protein